MEKKHCILQPPEDLWAIHGFYFKKNQIILLYSTSAREDSWIEIYKENHTNNNEIICWCQGHGINYQLLDKKCSKVYQKFVRDSDKQNL